MEYLLGAAGLHDAAHVHHGDAVADVGDDTEVVGDEENSQVALLLQSAQQVEDFRLDAYESGRGFVGLGCVIQLDTLGQGGSCEGGVLAQRCQVV